MPDLLALELYYSIILHIDNKSDLRSLALCCSTFRDEAQRRLFRDVDLPSITQWQKQQQQLFMSRVNRAPLRFGPWVHTLCMDSRWLNRDGMRESVSMALRAMYDLEHLDINWPKLSTILHGCTFKLRVFIARSPLDRTETLFLLCNFLPTQPRIKHLELLMRDEFNNGHVPTNLCPQLESLAIHADSLISILLPDARLIPHFQWLGYNRRPPPLTIRQLNHLNSFLFCKFPRSMDITFTQHLTSLVRLALIVTVDDVEQLVDEVSS